jgi:hypothetical protein
MNAYELYYTDTEQRTDEDGFAVTYVYVPLLDEWMTLDEFYFQKACYDPAMEDTRVYEQEHGSDDFLFDEDEVSDEDFEDDYSEDDYSEEDDPDYENMTYEEAVEEYNKTGINHSNYDLNDWDEINEKLGFEFHKNSKS